MSLLQGMENTHARLLLSLRKESGGATGSRDLPCIHDIVGSIVATHVAYVDAIERVLGAPSGSLYRADAQAVKLWVAVLQGNDSAR